MFRLIIIALAIGCFVRGFLEYPACELVDRICLAFFCLLCILALVCALGFRGE